jgi:hypothetical protein
MSKGKQPESRKPEPVKPAAAPGFIERHFTLIAVAVIAVLPLILLGKYLSGSVMLWGNDFIRSGGYASRQWMAEYFKQHGAFALWLPNIYSGLPTAAAFYGDIFHPLTVLLRYIMPVHIAWAWTFVIQIFLAGLGTYLYARELKLAAPAAFLMAIGYMFAGSVVSSTHEGHDGRLICTTMLPLVLFFLEKGIGSGRLVHFLLSAVMMGLQLYSGHVQQAYYTGFAVVIYFLFRFFSRLSDRRKPGARPGPTWRLAGYFVLMLVFLVGLVALQYLPIYGSVGSGVRGASRGWAFATSWAMGPIETLDLLNSRFMGGLEHYWGRNSFKGHTEYLGILPLLLALAGLAFTWRERFTKFLFGLLCLTVLMAWGGYTPFYYIPYYLFPGVAKFRAPSLIFFVSAFSIVALAGMGLKYIFGDKGQGPGAAEQARLVRFCYWAGGVGIGLLLIVAAGQGAVVSVVTGITKLDPNAMKANYSNLLAGQAIATVLIVLNAGLLWLVARRRLKPAYFAVAAGLLLVVDTWVVDSQYIKSYDPPATSFAADEAVSYLRQHAGDYRVMPVFYVDLRSGENKSDKGLLLVNNIENIGGQHPNPLQNYMDFLGSEKTVMFGSGLPSDQPGARELVNLRNRRFLDLLNVKYVVTALPADASKYPVEFQRQTAGLRQQIAQFVNQTGLVLDMAGRDATVYRNDSVLPRAFVVPDFEVRKDNEAAIARLKDPGFDLHRCVLLSEEPTGAKHPTDAAAGAPGTATVKSRNANKIVVEARMERPGFLVLSENYHPDWKAFDNGQPLTILRAYETLRAVYLDAGNHTVEFRYESKYLKIGGMLTLLSLLVLAGTGAFALVRRPKAA